MVKLSSLWKRPAVSEAASVQTARETALGAGGFLPVYVRDYAVYDGIRRAVPVIDAALDKICRLVGGVTPACPDDKEAEGALREFFRSVRVGAVSYGMESFVRCYLDSLLAYGNAAGEIVLTADGGDIAGLCNVPLRNICFQRAETPFGVKLCAVRPGEAPEPVPFPELVLFSALCPRAGELTGDSVLSGLPFVCDILMKIYASIGQNFERIANLRYAVTYRPGTGAVDRACAKEIAGNIAREWSDAMEAGKAGKIKDFVAVGDVDIKVIGADSRMIATEVPVRQMLEQIVAKLGIPPFLLGLNWSSTERMSAQQVDILTSELESYRRLLNPVLERICTVFLRVRGYACGARIDWDSINLQDELEFANARLTNLEADRLEAEIKNVKKGD